jgi:hypothetical protein
MLGVNPSGHVLKYHMVLGSVHAGSSPMTGMDLLSIALLSFIMIGALHEMVS